MLLEKKKQSRTFGQKAAKVLVFWASRGSAVSGQGSGEWPKRGHSLGVFNIYLM